MRRRLTSYLIVLMLILTLTLQVSSLSLAEDRNDAKEIILEKLTNLKSYVSTELPADTETFDVKTPHAAEGHKKAFVNKIKALINKVNNSWPHVREGAIKKLENDLAGTVEKWIKSDYYRSILLQKIEDILNLVKGVPVAAFSFTPETPVVGQVVTFDASESYDLNGYIVGYLWNFGDGTNDTGMIVEHIYVTHGTFTITLTVIDNDGLTDTAKAEITVSPIEVHDVAIFNVIPHPTTVVAGDLVTIEVEVENQGDFPESFDVTTYYDDAKIATKSVAELAADESTDLTFTWNTTGVSEGVYTIKAVASVVEGEEDIDDNTYEIKDAVTVVSPANPIAAFTFSPATPLAGQEVTFNASASRDPDGTIVSYTWNFGDNIVVTESDPITEHIYGKYGNYTIILTVTDNDGLTATESKPIKVIALPTASFTYEPLAPLVNEIIVFNASNSKPNGGEIESYTWDFGDGTVKSGEVVTHAYGSEGTYTVILNVTDTEGLWDISVVDITVYAVPDMPPQIISVFRVPQEPNYDECARILASVIDKENALELIILSYSVDDNYWVNQTMTYNEKIGLYTAQISAQPYGTNVSYRVYAYDKAGNFAVSDTYFYVVIDSRSPIISEVKRTPISPNYNDTVLITAKLNEPETASGIQFVILSYSDGVTWTNITMTQKTETIYEAGVPTMPYGTNVKYKVYALDNAGNWAVSFAYIYIVDDKYSPKVHIKKPTEGTYIRGLTNITVQVQEDNLKLIELTINETMVVSWIWSGEHAFEWNTTGYADGIYFIQLSALDKAGNIDEKTIRVTVDNTVPKALINFPEADSYLRGVILVNVTGDDVNFERMELRIGEALVKNWVTDGNRIFLWDTRNYADGPHRIRLTAYDKAGNHREVSIMVNIDNTSPQVEPASWTPKEPTTNENVTVTAKVIDPSPGSGVQTVVLWYRNATTEEWQPLEMSLNVTSGNWTAIIPAQTTETTISFYIEALDRAGNKALTDKTMYKVIAQPGIPLAWIAAIILLILATTAAAIYLWRKRRKEKHKSLNSSRVKNYQLTILLCF
jgi:PKD repeat protein